MCDCYEQAEHYDPRDRVEEHPLLVRIKDASSDVAAMRTEAERVATALEVAARNLRRQTKMARSTKEELEDLGKECEAMLEEQRRVSDDLVSFWTLPLHQRLWKAALGRRDASHDDEDLDPDQDLIDQ